MSPDSGQAREFLIPTTMFDYPTSPTDLRWFGDGRGLGFSGTDSRGAPSVFRLWLETGEWHTTPLTGDEGGNPSIEWNRDGSAFYFKRRGQVNAGIFERAVDGDRDRVVYRSPTPVLNIHSLELSPDRKWLAFQQFTADVNAKTVTKRIIVVDVATGETRKVAEVVRSAADSTDSGESNLVGWAPSGDLLVARRGTGGTGSETLLMPLTGSAPRSVAIPTFPPRRGETPSEIVAKWSPDGKTIGLRRVGRGWETFVIENPLASMRTPTVRR
jgi:Tol biopolymer transport system component